MRNISKYRVDYTILIPLLLMVVISIVTIHSAEGILGSESNNYMMKQLIWYGIGAIVIYLIMTIGNKNIYNNIWIFYWIGIVLLILLLLFGPEINYAKCWFKIPYIGAFQPSEFMKIILIITLGSMINQFRETYSNPNLKDEFLFLLKVLIVVAIPSILTFLQPDTGVVLIYLLITFVMLFIAGIRYRWFILVFAIAAIGIGSILGVYFLNSDLFIKLFGTSFFLRVDRLLDWSSGSGYQLENGITAIGSGGWLGFGMNNTPLYFPEPQTDFIFAVYASNFGFIGSIILIGIIAFFDIRIIALAIRANDNMDKYIIGGMIGMLIYQQVQNIGMTFGLIPITGITLPFISYGGSSLLSYLIMIAIIFNISNDQMRYRNV